MKKHRGYLIIAGVMAGLSGHAEMVITASTGLPDERDIVLAKAVDSVKETPVDTVAAVGGAVGFVADELRNTAHGVASAFQEESPRENVSANLLMDVEQAWDLSGKVQMKTFSIKEAVAKEMVAESSSNDAKIDVRSFFKNVEFPKGCSADYWPEFKRLVVRQTAVGMMEIVDVLAEHQESPDYRQVEIVTKFIEVEQKTLNELGFNWDFKDSWKISGNWTADLADQTLSSTLRSAANVLPGAASAGTLTLTKDGWMPLDLAIRALEQSAGADVLSAPSVTTLDGAAAEIWVGDREKMPTMLAPGSQGTSVYVDYGGWADKTIGVHLKVTPSVAEKRLINLLLKPEVIDLIGYDTYAITPSNASMLMWAGYPSSYTAQTGRYPIPNVADIASSAWNIMSATLGGQDPNEPNTGVEYLDFSERDSTSQTVLNVQKASVTDGYYDTRRAQTYEEFGVAVPQIAGSLPVFRVRKIETSMTVADGSTVGMGGLIYDKLETYKDKVPVLGSIPLVGRLFRSEGERSVKRNLMIFVTATQVDVNGRRSSEMAAR